MPKTLLELDYQVPSTGFSITVGNNTEVLALNPAGVLATGTILTPLYPDHGQKMILTSTQIVTALTMTASSGQVIGSAITTMAANTSYEWVYYAPKFTWIRLK